MTTDPVGWSACLDDLRAVADRLHTRIGSDGHPDRETDVALKMFGTIMATYLTHLWAEPEHPAFLPSVGYYQMYGSPNPDTIYRNAAIDGNGEYRISGHRGTTPDVSIMPFGPPVPGGLQTFAPFSFDDLAIEADGTFEVVLSARRPASAKNWWRLEPEMRTLMLRIVSDEWGVHTEPRIAIVRLDTDPRRTRTEPDALRRRFAAFATVVEGMVMSGFNRVAALRGDDVVNRLVTVDYAGTGGALDDQWYQEGCFALDDDEVLVLETPLDPECRAFSLALTDTFFSTIDWANAQSSLNRQQAVVDPDGILRVVVASADPGIHNWLDTTGHQSGVLQFRWSGTKAAPDFTVRTVAANALDDALPAGVARTSPEQRAEAIRARQAGVQLRAYW
jgi:hypothetical protein